MKLPDALQICQDPPNLNALHEMEKLLLIILGAAVQCSQKEQMIVLIKGLPFELQHAFVDKIKEVTENPNTIWHSDLDDPKRIDPSMKDELYCILVNNIKRVVCERDVFSHQVVEKTIALEKRKAEDHSELSPEKNHLALELSEFKAKFRKLNHQL